MFGHELSAKLVHSFQAGTIVHRCEAEKKAHCSSTEEIGGNARLKTRRRKIEKGWLVANR